MNKRLVAEVCAHHNVDDFRPYKIRFADKGSEEANLVHMIVAAIKKEADWNGWFDPYDGHASLKEVENLVENLVRQAPTKGIVKGAVLRRNTEAFGDNVTVGLIVFVDRGDNNYGFLPHYSDKVNISEEEFSNFGDKYITKWVSLV